MSTGSQESFIHLRKEIQALDEMQMNSRSTNSIECWSPPPSDLELQLATIPLILCHGKHEQIIDIPAYLHPTGERLKDSFLQTLVNVDENEEIASTIELTSRFLGFLAQEIELAKDLEMTLRREVLHVVFEQFEQTFLSRHELHEVLSNLPKDSRKAVIIQKYYEVQAILKTKKRQPESSLLRAAEQRRAALYAVCGGQGNTEPYLDELRSTYRSYSFLVRDFVTSSVTHLQNLATDVDASKSFPQGLDILNWLHDPKSQPNCEYLESAPVSFPLIGLTQLVHYVVSCRVLDIHPGVLRDKLSGITGHSQGIVPAIAIAASSDWESFETQATKALTILFWIGVRSQQAYPLASIPPIVLANARGQGLGDPTPCLSVRGMAYTLLERHIQTFNKYLPQDRQVLTALVNGPTNIVVAGPPLILHNFSQELRKIKGSKDHNPASCISQFLPISAPFHSRYLEGAVEQIVRDLQEIRIPAKDVGIPVYNTSTGEDIRMSPEQQDSIVPSLVDMICLQQVKWERAIEMPGATHILDFGTGVASGIGSMTSRMKDGRGVRVILCGALEGLSTDVGYKHELFARDVGDIKYAPNWLQMHGPKLERLANGKTFVATKMSVSSGLPPIMVAGMTPTTVPWDFVASTMSAGYEIELATGGYFDRDRLSSAIRNTMDNIPLGRGIILNLIYASPKSIAWQIPLIRELCDEGLPIKGITIGAGVPSIDVANDYIRTLGIRQIGFKPSSRDAIRQVIKIAEANPTFPVILQWTGGRGGGHHSPEDFHEPILNSYAQIRRCSNVVLLVGSGFGEPNEPYTYINGSWSRKFNRPPMPIDGILLGSRCMIAREAHTSPSVKQEIIKTQGVENHEWQKTHELHGAGGVISVRSEMGEPIHMIATRGVLLWAELERKIFSLPREKRRLELQKKDVRAYIMQRLYDDFQKPWFGLTTSRKLADLQSMTYGEVIHRMVELMFIKNKRRWIDPSLAKLTKDFINYIGQHFDMSQSQSQSPAEKSIADTKDLLDNPYLCLEQLLTRYPQIESRLMNSQDCEQFLHLCKRPGQKPVPFVPYLGDDFEFWFKKDSLWQSEDIDAVVEQDVGRVCILQGPVAVKHSKREDESIKDILDGFNNYFIDNLVHEECDGSRYNIPVVERFGGKRINSTNGDFESDQGPSVNICCHQTDQYVAYSTSASPVMSAWEKERWFQVLGGQFGMWRHAFIMSDSFIQDRRHVSNPMHRILARNKGMTVQISHPDEPARTTITITEQIHNCNVTTVQIGPIRNGIIPMNLIHHQTASGKAEPLLLEFKYQPESGYAPIHEVMDSRTLRVRDFYSAIWLGERIPISTDLPQASRFGCGSTTITNIAIQNFTEIIGNKSETYIQRFGSSCLAPMDIAIVVGWKALVKPLLQTIDGDLLALVHLSNTFSMMPKAEPLKIGDVLTTSAEITAIVNQSSGKMVEICGYINRPDGVTVMAITSRFLYRGKFKDYANTFQRTLEKPFKVHLATPQHVAILKAKKWFKMENASTVLLGKVVIFRLKTTVTFNGHGSFASVETLGTIEVERSTTRTSVQFASVMHSVGESQGNEVLAYLRRTGSEVDQVLYLEQPVFLGNDDGSPLTFQAPKSNGQYAEVSGDYNPIHTSSLFSEYVNLPGTITHGMYTSGVIRSIVENWIANNDAGMMRDFHTNFKGMVLPGDVIEVRLNHIGMAAGCKIIKIEATKAGTGETVLTGETTLKQPSTAYIFTGQGSQEQGMGMDLYAKSNVAREIWARAEKHLLETYGFSIIDIVKNNPKELTVHFGGVRGKAIRQTYMSMVRQGLDQTPSGTFRTEKLFDDITEDVTSYTYRSPTGLLSATQFTQPALTVMQMAAFAHSRSRGIIQKESVFAGHSLGEYSALATVAEVMELETLLSIVFYRGLCMQAAVRRDKAGRSDFSMCAVNPTRISNRFNEKSLQYLVSKITSHTGSFLEIVNFNVQGMQYVCAGELRGLDILTGVTNAIKSEKMDLDNWESQAELTKELIQQAVQRTDAKARPLELKQGTATIPLPGIDVPFHSSYLRSQIHTFRSFLLQNIDPNGFDPEKLVAKYVPNVTAKPFQLTKDYIEYAHKVTESPRLGKILQSWESEMSWDEFEP